MQGYGLNGNKSPPSELVSNNTFQLVSRFNLSKQRFEKTFFCDVYIRITCKRITRHTFKYFFKQLI